MSGWHPSPPRCPRLLLTSFPTIVLYQGHGHWGEYESADATTARCEASSEGTVLFEEVTNHNVGTKVHQAKSGTCGHIKFVNRIFQLKMFDVCMKKVSMSPCAGLVGWNYNISFRKESRLLGVFYGYLAYCKTVDQSNFPTQDDLYYLTNQILRLVMTYILSDQLNSTTHDGIRCILFHQLNSPTHDNLYYLTNQIPRRMMTYIIWPIKFLDSWCPILSYQSVLTSHDAIRQDHDPDVGGECAQNESSRRYHSSHYRHSTTTIFVGKNACDRS